MFWPKLVVIGWKVWFFFFLRNCGAQSIGKGNTVIYCKTTYQGVKLPRLEDYEANHRFER
mgnify:CR=1 FL=1